MESLNTSDLLNKRLDPKNVAKLNSILTGDHNEFDITSITNVSSHQENVRGTFSGINYTGIFWQTNINFGVTVENENTLMTYYSTKDDNELIVMCTKHNGEWSKSVIETKDSTINAKTINIDKDTFQSIIPQDEDVSVRTCDNLLKTTDNYPYTVEERTLTETNMISLFNNLIESPQSLNNKSFSI